MSVLLPRGDWTMSSSPPEMMNASVTLIPIPFNLFALLVFGTVVCISDPSSVWLVVDGLRFLVAMNTNFPLGLALAGTFFGGLHFRLLTAISSMLLVCGNADFSPVDYFPSCSESTNWMVQPLLLIL